MKTWHIVIVSVVIIISGWLLRTRPSVESNTASFAGWIISIGLVMLAFSIYDILKHK